MLSAYYYFFIEKIVIDYCALTNTKYRSASTKETISLWRTTKWQDLHEESSKYIRGEIHNVTYSLEIVLLLIWFMVYEIRCLSQNSIKKKSIKMCKFVLSKKKTKGLTKLTKLAPCHLMSVAIVHRYRRRNKIKKALTV